MASRLKILVVEDENAIRQGIVDALSFAGYEVEEAGDGIVGLNRALAPELGMLLLDLMLPGRDGMEILAEVRKAKPHLPVIILTARGLEEDRVRGLKEGADDYIVKPFSAKELIARVEAVLRRTAERPHPLKHLEFPECRIDFNRCEVVLKDGTREDLTPKEAAFLTYLASNRGRAVSRTEILERVWGIDAKGLDTRAVDMLVARLRGKLRDKESRIVRTIRAQGYSIGEGR